MLLCPCRLASTLSSSKDDLLATVRRFSRSLGTRTVMGPPVAKALSALRESSAAGKCQSLIVISDGAARDRSAAQKQFLMAKGRGIQTMMVVIGEMAASLFVRSNARSWLSKEPFFVRKGFAGLAAEIGRISSALCSRDCAQGPRPTRAPGATLPPGLSLPPYLSPFGGKTPAPGSTLPPGISLPPWMAAPTNFPIYGTPSPSTAFPTLTPSSRVPTLSPSTSVPTVSPSTHVPTYPHEANVCPTSSPASVSTCANVVKADAMLVLDGSRLDGPKKWMHFNKFVDDLITSLPIAEYNIGSEKGGMKLGEHCTFQTFSKATTCLVYLFITNS